MIWSRLESHLFEHVLPKTGEDNNSFLKDDDFIFYHGLSNVLIILPMFNRMVHAFSSQEYNYIYIYTHVYYDVELI